MGASVRGAFELIVLTSTPKERSEARANTPADQIEGCRRGDRGALEAVFRAHAPALARLLRRMVGPTADVEDLLQDTFANAIPAFKTFRGEASVSTWLHRIAIHVAHGHLRRPRHHREVALPDADAIVGDAGLPPEQLTARLYVHLDQLDPDKRIALLLYAIEEHTLEEIATLMGASKTATRSRIFRARRALMKRMRQDPAFADRQLPLRGAP